MASDAVPADYSCRYCLQDLVSMEDPRRLPCGHVFCLECLRSDFSGGGTHTKCPQCGLVHEDLDLDGLPEICDELEVKDVKESKYPPVYCSRECYQVAVCFCGDCSSKFCKTHKEAHDTFFGSSHKYVAFEEYQRLPDKYDRPMCVTHGQPLSLACDVCDVIVCEECELTSNCGQYGNSHKFKSLAKQKKKFNKEYKELIDSISKMHSEFKTKEKDTFYRFDDLVDTYDEEGKLKAIDKVAEEQIAEIRRRSEIKKKHGREFPAKMDAQVTIYAEELQGKEQQLGELEKSLNLLMRESHITEIIRQNKDNKKKIDDAQALTTGNCDVLREMVVAPTGCLRDIEVHLRPLVPTKLENFFNGSSSESVQLLTLTDQGDLLLYNSSGVVKVTDTHCKVTRASLSIPNVISLAQSRDTVFVVTYESNNLVCTSYNYYSFALEKKICQFRTKRSNSHLIAVCDDYIVLVDNSSYIYQLHVYNQQGTFTRSLNIERKITGIWSLPEGYVLVRNDSNEVLRCEIKSSTVTKLGTNSNQAMTTDSVGLCYSAKYVPRNFQKISFYRYMDVSGESGGAMVGEATTQETKSISEISVKNDILAVRDENSRVHLYHVEY